MRDSVEDRAVGQDPVEQGAAARLADATLGPRHTGPPGRTVGEVDDRREGDVLDDKTIPSTAVDVVERRTYPALTGLRIVAALWVVLYHISGSLEGTFAGPLAVVWPVIRAGWVGVDLFFILSGFVVTHSYFHRMGPRFDPRTTARFLWARVARIWPVWALLSAVMMVVLAVTGDPDRPDSYSSTFSWWSTIRQAFLVQMWGEGEIARTSYIVPGWSLSAEWTAYLVFPVLVLVVFRLRSLPTSLLAAACVGCVLPYVVLTFAEGDNQNLWLLRITGGFLSGALLHLVVTSLHRRPWAERFAPMLAVVCTAEVVAVAIWAAADTTVPRQGVVVVFFPPLVAALALSRRGLAVFLSRPMLILGGKISFSLYLLHTVVFLAYESLARSWGRLSPGTPTYEFVLLQVLVLLLPVSYLLWRFVEEPSRRWLIGRFQPARPGRARHLAPPLGSVKEESGAAGPAEYPVTAQRGRA